MSTVAGAGGLGSTWADVQAWSFGSASRNAAWVWVVLPLGCAFALAFPVPAAVLVSLALLFALIWRRPESVLLLLVALMGNVKVNYYATMITVFPEYLVLAISVVVVALRAMEGRREVIDRETGLWFAAWTFAGLMSFVSAYNVGRVFSKTMLLPISALVFHWAHSTLRDDERLERALRWLEASVFVMAVYGIAQMVGVVLHVDTSLSFLRRWGNPEFEYSIGAPVLYRLTSTFRANSLFNDPNILAGYLAAGVPLLLSATMSPALNTSRRRTWARWTVLIVVLFCLLLTLSRSGFLGAVCGVGVMLLWTPRRLLVLRLWLAVAAAVGGLSAAALAIKVNPFVLVWRIASSVGTEDYSTRIHKDLVRFGLDLLWRHPLTGIGARNFGEYYAREVDPRMVKMMMHNAFLGNFVESGLLGGAMFVGLVLTIWRRVVTSMRLPGLRERHPGRHALLAGLSGSIVALAVSNVFYDYSLRTFVWVYCGLAYGVARLAAREDAA